MIVIAFAGLPGTGKSTLARAVAARLDAVVLDKDLVREALFGARVDYSREQNDLACRAMYREAQELGTQGVEIALLDGRTYSKRYQVEELREFARGIGATLMIVECTCAAEVARARIERDALSGAHPALNRTPDLHEQIEREQEPLIGARLVLRTDLETVEQCAARVIAWTRESVPSAR